MVSSILSTNLFTKTLTVCFSVLSPSDEKPLTISFSVAHQPETALFLVCPFVFRAHRRLALPAIVLKAVLLG